MFILPYVYHHRKLPHLTVYEVSILTMGGTELWKEDDGMCVTTDILEPNGLSTHSCHKYKDVVFCHVNESQLDMTEYFHWKESETKPDATLFCWRPFYLIASPSPQCDLWLPFPSTERLGPYGCQELFAEILPTLSTTF